MKLQLGQIVYLITDTEQLDRMVTAICERDNGVQYELSCGSHISWHYRIEISTECDVLKKFKN